MASEDPALRAVVERNADAVVAGNFVQIMADITPEALGKLMAMAGGGQPSIATLPAISGYEIVLLDPEDEAQRYRATFHSEAGTAAIITHWKHVYGAWKIVDVSGVDLQPSAGGEV